MAFVLDTGKRFNDGLVVRNVSLVDGGGGPPRVATITISGGLISGVYDAKDDLSLKLLGDGRNVLDGTGLVALPGFVDSHVHSDLELLRDPQHAASLGQGVTTEVLGQDGLSYAPLSPENLSRYRPYLSPLNGAPPIRWDWSSVESFRGKFDGTVAVNTAYLVPHGTLRFEVQGMSSEPLSGRALQHACHLLEESFQEGAAGFSTGLSYFPSSFASTDELVALARVAARYGRPYVTHVRTVFPHGEIDPLEEALLIGRLSGAAVHISHHRTGIDTLGRVDEIMSSLDAAYERGDQISFDTYPYLHGSGPLYVCLPPWVFEGGLDETLSLLADRAVRPRLVAGINENLIRVEGRFTSVPGHPEYESRDIREVAVERDQSVPDLVCDLLLAERLDVMFHQGTPGILEDRSRQRQFESDVLSLLDRPFAMVGSDGVYVGRTPHERGFGTFARLVRLAREHGFPIEKLANRMSAVASDVFGLSRRGRLRLGDAADIVLLDPSSTRERSTPDWPRRGPVGIATVIVNGEVAVDAGGPTGLFAGRALAPG